jgi:glycosyltransferase involved in cell wall biosynthesis
MKKILFLHSSSELYGSDRSLLNLIKNIDKENFVVTVVLPDNGPLVDELKKIKGVEVLIKDIAVLRRKYLSVKGLIYYGIDFINSIFYLSRIIFKKKIDIVYTNTSVVFPGGIAAKMLGKKSIWHIREIIENKLERKVVSTIVNLFSDTIIANSRATASSISQNSKKLKVVYNAIESKGTQTTSNKVTSKNEIVVGMAGRINRWKGQKLFVDMAEKVLQENKSVKFEIAGGVYKGEDQLLDDLMAYINNKGLESKVTLLGQVDDMDFFYNNIDIFILPSIQPEPFGLVVLEAMEREIPVVATNHGGPVEIIENNVDGYLVDYVDASEMSKVVLQLACDSELRKKIGQSGRKKRRNTFSLENYVSSICKILMDI